VICQNRVRFGLPDFRIRHEPLASRNNLKSASQLTPNWTLTGGGVELCGSSCLRLPHTIVCSYCCPSTTIPIVSTPSKILQSSRNRWHRAGVGFACPIAAQPAASESRLFPINTPEAPFPFSLRLIFVTGESHWVLKYTRDPVQGSRPSQPPAIGSPRAASMQPETLFDSAEQAAHNQLDT
jgi:hypothetical protein